MPAAGTEYWFVGTGETGHNRDGIYALLKSKLQQAKLVDDTAVFEIPSKLKFGRFDDLVSLLDDVQKHDTFITQTCHKLEKQGLEVDPSAEFKVIWQRNTLTADEYLKKFMWDEAKYSNSRVLRQNVDLIVNSVQKLDDEIRTKVQQLQDLKNQSSHLAEPVGSSLTTRDLVYILLPSVVGPEPPFVYTDKLTTVVCVCPHQETQKFMASYWRLDDKVVPGSLHKFDISGSSASGQQEDLFSVTLFKTSVSDFRDKCRAEFKVTVREFQYDDQACERRNQTKMKVDADKMQSESMLLRICIAAYSECFVSLVHIKAVRMYIEGILRYGANASISGFILQLPAKYKEAKIRDVLSEILSSNIIGKEFFKQTDGADNEEVLYPYLQLSIVPFTNYAY